MSFKQINVQCHEDVAQILMAEMSVIGYDIFEENEEGFTTSIASEQFNKVDLQTVFDKYHQLFDFQWKSFDIEKVNWNEEWEKNYQPVQVGDQVYVRAIFHEPKPEFPFEIVIHPKMSFGTGHHDTTHLVLKQQLTIPHQDCKVYDFGSGTGILAIMAGLLGATSILGNDVDDWCIENAKENLSLNKINAEMLLGPVKSLNLTQQAEIILANINKNILMEEMEEYARLLKPNGHLVISGFYQADIPDLEKKGHDLGLLSKHHETKNKWSTVVFTKPS